MFSGFRKSLYLAVIVSFPIWESIVESKSKLMERKYITNLMKTSTQLELNLKYIVWGFVGLRE